MHLNILRIRILAMLHMQATKNTCCAKCEGAVVHSMVIIEEIWLIDKNLDYQTRLRGLKAWIPRPCSKALWQIWQIVLGEHQSSSTSLSSVWQKQKWKEHFKNLPPKSQINPLKR